MRTIYTLDRFHARFDWSWMQQAKNITTRMTPEKTLQLLHRLKRKNGRTTSKYVTLEGRRVVEDAVLAGARITAVVYAKKDTLKGIPIPEGEFDLIPVEEKWMSKWSTLSTPPGIVALAELPKFSNVEAGDLTVICDNVREPGNMGTLIRCAAAAGASTLLALRGCCDVWESKCMRGGMGSHFRIPIIQGLHWKDLPTRIPKLSQIFVPTCEQHSGCEEHEEMPISPYYEADFHSSPHIALALSGETSGFSEDSVEFLKKGKRIHIPMLNGIQSLNVSTAASVILFEIRKQRLNV